MLCSRRKQTYFVLKPARYGKLSDPRCGHDSGRIKIDRQYDFLCSSYSRLFLCLYQLSSGSNFLMSLNCCQKSLQKGLRFHGRVPFSTSITVKTFCVPSIRVNSALSDPSVPFLIGWVGFTATTVPCPFVPTMLQHQHTSLMHLRYSSAKAKIIAYRTAIACSTQFQQRLYLFK